MSAFALDHGCHSHVVPGLAAPSGRMLSGNSSGSDSIPSDGGRSWVPADGSRLDVRWISDGFANRSLPANGVSAQRMPEGDETNPTQPAVD